MTATARPVARQRPQQQQELQKKNLPNLKKHSRAMKEAMAWMATEHWPDLTVTEGNEGLQQQQQQQQQQQRVIHFHDIDNIREFDSPPTPGDSYNIFFANVTSLGTKVKTWVRSALDVFHVFAFVETHVTDKIAAAISRFF